MKRRLKDFTKDNYVIVKKASVPYYIYNITYELVIHNNGWLALLSVLRALTLSMHSYRGMRMQYGAETDIHARILCTQYKVREGKL